MINKDYYFFTGWCDNALSNISQSQPLAASGWITDSTSLNHANYRSTCDFGKTWYGFIGGDPVGSIWTTFQGTGTATLSFGNCIAHGTVKVFLNEKEIAEATLLQRKEISFDYSVGDVLKIGEYDTAIWKLYSFSVQCK